MTERDIVEKRIKTLEKRPHKRIYTIAMLEIRLANLKEKK